MKKVLVLFIVLMLTGCQKETVYYCLDDDLMKDKVCYKETFTEASYNYYCPNGMGEVKDTSCILDGLLTGNALKEYTCSNGTLTSENKCLVTTSYPAKTKKVSKSKVSDYTRKYNTYNKTEQEEKEPTSNTIREIPTLTYSESKVNIYEFYGEECPHCMNLNAFLNSIEEEYGKYYTLNKFEVWHNDENKEIYKEFASTLGYEAKSVPFVIIGDKVIKGFSDEKKDEIISAITSQYKNSYDVYFNGR